MRGAAAEVEFDTLSGRTIPAEGKGRVLFYEDWLAVHPTAPAAAEACRRLFALESDAPRLLDAAVRFLDTRDAAQVPDLLETTARLAALLGRTEEAQDFFRRGHAAGAGSTALIYSIGLFHEMGETEKARELSVLPGALDGRGAAIVPYVCGPAAAPQALTEGTADPAVRLAALYFGYLHWRDAADAVRAEQALSLLGREFPRSPEYALCGPAAGASARVRLAATPGSFLVKTASGTASVAASGTASGSTRNLAVQTGSFGVRENAEDMVKELTKIGFSPTIREVQRDGRRYYSVMAAVGLTREEGQAVIDALKDKNYEGFLRPDPAP